MKRIILLAAAALSLSACNPTGTPPGSVSDVPVVGSVCAAISSDKFDVALKAYGAAADAVNLLIDAKVLVSGTPRALAVATANDRVLTAFAVAERARRACNSASYTAAMAEVSVAITEIRTALRS